VIFEPFVVNGLFIVNSLLISVLSSDVSLSEFNQDDIIKLMNDGIHISLSFIDSPLKATQIDSSIVTDDLLYNYILIKLFNRDNLECPILNYLEHIKFENIIKNKLSKLTMDELRSKFKIVEDDDEQQDKMKMIEKIIFELPRLEIINMAKLKFIKNKITLFWSCFYFSFCTFTTIGVGDWYPRNSISKCLVMLEGALGWICLGLFITSYGSQLLR